MIILQFQTAGLDPRVTGLNVYRIRAAVVTRIVQLPIQGQYYDNDGLTGDIYYYTFWDGVRFLESGPSPLITVTDSRLPVTVTGYIKGHDATTAMAEVEVTVKLQSLSLSTPFADGLLISSLSQVVETDADGRFVFLVTPNDRIYPADTFYTIEYLDKKWSKTVSSTNGAAQWFTNLIDVSPKELR
jgi:hypothetical protein